MQKEKTTVPPRNITLLYLNILKGKIATLFVAAADGPEACGPMVEMFKLSFDYLEMDFIGSLLGTAYEKREILNDHNVLLEAHKLGMSIKA